MEAIKPGASASLQRFSKSGSLHRMPPNSQDLHSAYDPYSVENQYVSNGTHGRHDSASSLKSLPSPLSHAENYIEPVSSGGWSYGSQSECIGGSPPVKSPQNLAQSVDSRLTSFKQRSSDTTAKSNTSKRVTYSHNPREQLTVLSRSNTERRSKSPEHLYEMDTTNMTRIVKQTKPPLPDRNPTPPKPKPRKPKGPPKGLYNKSPDSSIASPNELESRYTALCQIDGANKEPDYDIPIVQSLSSREQSKVSIDIDEPRPDQTNKPKVTPRKKAPHSPKKLEEPEYLELTDQAKPRAAENVSGDLSKLQNFSPDQIDMLTKMLQQIQSGGMQQPVVKEVKSADDVSGQGMNSREDVADTSTIHTTDATQLKRKFGEF